MTSDQQALLLDTTALRTNTAHKPATTNTQPRDAPSPKKFSEIKYTTRSQRQVGRMPVPRSMQTDGQIGHPNIIMPPAPSIGGIDVENVPEKITKKPSKMWQNKRKTFKMS